MTELPVIQQPMQQLSAPLLEHLARRMRTAMESKLDTFGLRARHLIALTVMRDLGESSQANLAEALRLDRTNLVGLLNELEQAGLVERQRAPEDRRRHLVALTAAGKRRLAQLEKALAGVEEEVLSGLDFEQRVALHSLLQLATANAPGMCQEDSPPSEC
jgi:DNA-binding MarR family transcriptional regulator